jgi:predicted transposase YbfD/YdcC
MALCHSSSFIEHLPSPNRWLRPVHYVRDVTQGEDKSRTRMYQLSHIFAVARNFALNSYRSLDFSNMAQAERMCKYGLDILKLIFRMK